MKNEHLNDKKESTTAILIALVANLLISIIKFIGYFISASPSMLAEAIHSVADSFNQILLFMGVRYASIVPTKTHPWGTGSRQYLFNLFSAVGVFIIGCVVTISHAVHELMNPTPSINERALTVAIIILCISLLVEGYSFYKAISITLKKVKRSNRSFLDYIRTTDDSSLVAILLEDGVAVFGVLIALLGIGFSKYYDSSIPDAVAAIMIGTILGVISVFLFKNNLAFILGKATDRQKELEIREFISGFNSVDHVVDLKTEILGPNRIHLVVEIDLDNSALIDVKQIRKDAQVVRQDPTKLYETLVDTWMRGARTVARELNSIDQQVKEKFKEVEIAHFEVLGGEHIEKFELLQVVMKDDDKEFNHIDMIKIKGTITTEKVLKSLMDINLIEENRDYVVNIDLDEGFIDVYLNDNHIYQLRD